MSKYKIALDPGHAKSTSGKRSFDGTLREYEFNRGVAEKVNYLLGKIPEIQTMYPLDFHAEKDTPVWVRAKNANKAGCDLYVSFHANAFGSTWNNANGFEILIGPNRSDSRKFVNVVYDYMIKHIGLRSRGIKTGNFSVITQTKMPSILIEYGFFTNKVEVAKLKDEKFRDLAARCTVNGILTYLKLPLIPLEPFKPTPEKPVEVKPEPPKVDETKHWAYKHFKFLNDNGIKINEMKFDDTITRAETYVLLSNLLSLVDKEEIPDDKENTHWAEKYYEYLNIKRVAITDKNYINKVTRAEAFVLFSNLMNRNGALAKPALKGEHWAKPFKDDLVKNHKIKISENKFKEEISRGAFMSLLAQVLEKESV